ncbi:2-oxoglutarate dehydrogenase E1 [Niallia circulans]|uniref:2-oxoglutarate dehydrogenase E1 component n=1 Tax=Niallia circulans TaxID=1397 RepID=UPI00077C998E|nr:2-oxoglutarate dehydrogenase E1 component [Niallia circulans]MDR4315142.1 2-oxoglutarate dehydrogenase E1 component [Niallia circulans]MED3839874.1 2-oxoglutarate dehydrogenase E1 component [Niallia circulans]MED4241360.1 2-oxoglutarate dehydrogenase E1 component [Niallia circulans]MED4248021.1 2-oxoglutarate dehydrogenase E1 component [Niallia circulans]QKH61505.1 2-oxoglutarate dehydrogenase E1 component [Niallia circulans]
MEKPSDGTVSYQPRFYGPNLGLVMELYEKYVQDPNSVDEEMKRHFDQWGPPIDNQTKTSTNHLSLQSEVQVEKIIAAVTLVNKIRAYGHLAADIYPLKDHKREYELFDLARFDLTKEDLEKIPARLICPDAPNHIINGYEAVQYLKEIYTKTIAFEYYHVNDIKEKNWLQSKVESGSLKPACHKELKRKLLKRVIEVEEFENFLHRTYVGQKRFSIEGLDTMVPMIDKIISESVLNGAQNINIGMAHRGRLNVLAHVLEKPYEMIFAEFQHAPNKQLVPSEGSIGISFGWTGDVKYHLGLDRQIKSNNVSNVRLTLANNPSHLEFVGAVVEGFTRASQDDRTKPGFPAEDSNKSLAILIHGDAAFPGQGIVSETLNLTGLKGYRTGGTIHIIANNTIGFTTESSDSRSTRYASDLAKGFEIPIIHVNADDPEACIKAAKLAIEYREKFKKDFLIDLIGYRRYGHNEMDEPMTTNPLMYKLIHEHPTITKLYGEKLVAENVINEEDIQALKEEVTRKLKEAHDRVPKKNEDPDITNPPNSVERQLPKVKTSVPIEQLKQINSELLSYPSQFQVFDKLGKVLKRRNDALEGEGKIDWSLAETLAFSTILEDGTPIRLSGQDSERGTFAHRNIILHDYVTGKQYSPLHTLSKAKASFAVHNSPLSEGSVLGFEYGYNVHAPETLVLWEAQFGDFANAAQVMFDQFIAAGRAKWGQKSGLVMLLPHGYEGQGPEHSSARLERFLILAAENNWTVANLSSSAQYFHILRRQAAILNKEEVRPLVIMTPKSLLRNADVASNGLEFSEGAFHSVLEVDNTGQNDNAVTRLVLSTGKISIDLYQAHKKLENAEAIHLARVEEIYPFPEERLTEIIQRYPNLKEVVWVQEEPKNMGAWSFMEPRIRKLISDSISLQYVGRRRRSSPAEGDPIVHRKDQARIVNEALTME